MADQRPPGLETYQLSQLRKLRDQGVITDDVFEQQQAVLLAQSVARSSTSRGSRLSSARAAVFVLVGILMVLVVILSIVAAVGS